MSAVLATRAVAPAAHGAAARRLTAGRSAFAHAAPPSIKRAFAARRASASRATHVLTTAGWNDFEWGTATVVSNEPAAAEGGLRSVKVSVDEACAEAYGTPGQFVQMRTNADAKPAFLAIASPPRAEPKTVLELLIKSTEGTAGEICALKQGATVDVSPPMGGGFDLEGKAPAAAAPKALLFATGSGISPVRALIKSGALDGRDVSLFYGTTSERTCAFFRGIRGLETDARRGRDARAVAGWRAAHVRAGRAQGCRRGGRRRRRRDLRGALRAEGDDRGGHRDPHRGGRAQGEVYHELLNGGQEVLKVVR